MKKTVLIFAALLALGAGATQYSKLKLVRALKSAGRWGDFKTFVSQAGLTDEWESAAYLTDDYPDFALVTNQLVAAGFATAAEVEALLAAPSTMPPTRSSHKSTLAIWRPPPAGCAGTARPRKW